MAPCKCNTGGSSDRQTDRQTSCNFPTATAQQKVIRLGWNAERRFSSQRFKWSHPHFCETVAHQVNPRFVNPLKYASFLLIQSVRRNQISFSVGLTPCRGFSKNNIAGFFTLDQPTRIKYKCRWITVGFHSLFVFHL